MRSDYLSGVVAGFLMGLGIGYGWANGGIGGPIAAAGCGLIIGIAVELLKAAFRSWRRR